VNAYVTPFRAVAGRLADHRLLVHGVGARDKVICLPGDGVRTACGNHPQALMSEVAPDAALALRHLVCNRCLDTLGDNT
jgi:hypothetical protein